MLPAMSLTILMVRAIEIRTRMFVPSAPSAFCSFHYLTGTFRDEFVNIHDIEMARYTAELAYVVPVGSVVQPGTLMSRHCSLLASPLEKQVRFNSNLLVNVPSLWPWWVHWVLCPAVYTWNRVLLQLAWFVDVSLSEWMKRTELVLHCTWHCRSYHTLLSVQAFCPGHAARHLNILSRLSRIVYGLCNSCQFVGIAWGRSSVVVARCFSKVLVRT